MPSNPPSRHHYVPRFFLRNFATDPSCTKLTTVMKSGHLAIWGERSIKGLGFEDDFYVHMRHGVPVSVETLINRQIETPLSQSDTWAKISSNRTDLLDRSDKPMLYAMIRHLQARTPHYLATQRELAAMAADPTSTVEFSDEERFFFAAVRRNPDIGKAQFNAMAASLEWTEANFRGSGISVLRSRVPLRSSSTPVHAIPTAPHPALYLPLPGMVPHQLVLTLNPYTIATLVLGNFDDAFLNIEIEEDVALGFNRQYVAQFSHFEHVRHLITDRHTIVSDMIWAPYDLVSEDAQKIVFRRRGLASA